jgi:putative molybdopterin biosynthesis protein
MEKKNALSTEDVANMLGVSKSTVDNLIKTGEIASYKVGRKVRFTQENVNDFIKRSSANQATIHKGQEPAPGFDLLGKQQADGSFTICGQDVILDVLSNYMRSHGVPALRAYIGSYDALMLLYKDKVNVASSHLWDSETNEYNIPYVKRLLPGVQTIVIHLTCRMQGLYVQKGNPKGIQGWEDFRRSDIVMINREHGAGARVLLDENLKLLGIQGSSINGYGAEGQAHMTLASAVSAGKADVAVGVEKIARQVDNIDFIPLKKERYDLVIKKEQLASPEIATMLKIINSEAFKQEFSHVGGYDTSDMGKVVAEI